MLPGRVVEQAAVEIQVIYVTSSPLSSQHKKLNLPHFTAAVPLYARFGGGPIVMGNKITQRPMQR